MRRNKEEVEPLVRLAESYGANSVKFNIVQPASRGESMHRSGETLSIEELVELGRWVEGDLSKQAGLRVVFHHPLAFRPLHKIYGNPSDGCGVCGILGILGVLADGSYALCGIGETVPELVFGRAEKDRLEDIWTGSPVLLAIRRGIPGKFEGVCGNCAMKSRCRGCCIAQNYYSNGNLWSPFWYCREAHDKRLFPKTRIKPRSYYRR